MSSVISFTKLHCDLGPNTRAKLDAACRWACSICSEVVFPSRASSGLQFCTWAGHLGCYCAVSSLPLGPPEKRDVLAGELVPSVCSYLSVYSPCPLFQDSLAAMLQWLLQKHYSEEVLRLGLCTEGALLLLEMLKATMSQVRPIPHVS